MKKLIWLLIVTASVATAQTRFPFAGHITDATARASATAALDSAAAKVDTTRFKADSTKLANLKVFNVLDYGADPTGVANNDAAFALALAAARQVCGRVFVPSGRYVYRTTIDIDTVGMSLVGAGVNSTVLLYHGDGTENAISVCGAVSYLNLMYGVELSGFTLLCDSALSGIDARGLARSTIHDIKIGTPLVTAADDDEGANYYTNAIMVKQGMALELRNISIAGKQADATTTQYGIVLDTLSSTSNYTTTVTIINPYIRRTSVAAVDFRFRTYGCVLYGGACEANAGWGVKMTGAWENNTIDNTWFEANTLGDVLIDATHNVSLNNLTSGNLVQTTGETYEPRFTGGYYDSIMVGNETYRAQLIGVRWTSGFVNSGIKTVQINTSKSALINTAPEVNISGGVVAVDSINTRAAKVGTSSGVATATSGVVAVYPNNPGYFRKAGTWHNNATNAIAATATALTANQLRAYPWVVEAPITIDSLHYEISTAANGTHVTIGIYNDSSLARADAPPYPMTKLFQGVSDSGAPARVIPCSGLGASNLTLVPGLYWVVYHTDGTPTIRTVPVSALSTVLGNAVTVGTSQWSCIYYATAYSATLPDPFTSGGASTGTAAPMIVYKIKSSP